MSAASAEYVASWGNMEQWERFVENLHLVFLFSKTLKNL